MPFMLIKIPYIRFNQQFIHFHYQEVLSVLFLSRTAEIKAACDKDVPVHKNNFIMGVMGDRMQLT